MEVGSYKPASPSRTLSWPASPRLLLEQFDDSDGFFFMILSVCKDLWAGYFQPCSCAAWVLLLLLLPCPSYFQGLASFGQVTLKSLNKLLPLSQAQFLSSPSTVAMEIC